MWRWGEGWSKINQNCVTSIMDDPVTDFICLISLCDENEWQNVRLPRTLEANDVGDMDDAFVAKILLFEEKDNKIFLCGLYSLSNDNDWITLRSHFSSTIFLKCYLHILNSFEPFLCLMFIFIKQYCKHIRQFGSFMRALVTAMRWLVDGCVLCLITLPFNL